MKDKIAVVLFNLGGPDSLEAVQPFLFNLFSDPDIFKLPLGFITQKPFAYMIARRRKGEASRGYAAIGGKSPLLENTQRQANALTEALASVGDYDVHICMRYWHPLTDKVINDLKHRGYKKVILLPLYPQYSLTTTGSSYNEFIQQCRRQDYHPQALLIENWHNNEAYLDAIVDDIHVAQQSLPDSDPAQIELLFSAHGLPQKFVDAGDPYEQQIRATYETLCTRLKWPRTSLCYQSRVGPLKWLSPYTEDMIRLLGQAGVQQVLVYPIAFVSDHTETLYELGIQYAQLAKTNGINHYRVIPALNDRPKLVQALVEQVRSAAVDEKKFHSI